MNSKYALLVGINYYNTNHKLSGCINDTKMLRRHLINKGYDYNNIAVLRDDNNGNLAFVNSCGKDSVTNCAPTKNNIVNSLKQLITKVNDTVDSGQGCEAFFYYSGHGTSIYDMNGDESDYYDEVLVPVDSDVKGFITDDYIRYLLKDLNNKVKLYILTDCCNSGTNIDLPYTFEYTDKFILRENNSDVYNELVDKKIQSISGCRDDQTSADLYSIYKCDYDSNNINENDIITQNQTAGGALTYSFLKASTDIDFSDYTEIYKNLLTSEFRKKFQQVPLLSSTIDITYSQSYQQQYTHQLEGEQQENIQQLEGEQQENIQQLEEEQQENIQQLEGEQQEGMQQEDGYQQEDIQQEDGDQLENIQQLEEEQLEGIQQLEGYQQENIQQLEEEQLEGIQQEDGDQQEDIQQEEGDQQEDIQQEEGEQQEDMSTNNSLDHENIGNYVRYILKKILLFIKNKFFKK